MSDHHVDWCSRVVLPPSKKLVLMCLADSADRQTGRALPGFENLLVWSGLSRSQCSAVVAELIAAGLIERLSGGSRGHRAEFRIACPCPDHRNNGSGVPDPIYPKGSGPQDPKSAKGSGPQDPKSAKGSGKGPERVRQLPDPSLTSSTTTTSLRGTRLPDDFTLTDEMTQWAHGYCAAMEVKRFTLPELTDQTDRFRDYWTAQPGQRGLKRDWAGTWRNWIRKAAENRPKVSSTPTPSDKPVILTREQRAERNRIEAERQIAIARAMDEAEEQDRQAKQARP